jgi:DNA-binding GntR family transcriptional regulator
MQLFHTPANKINGSLPIHKIMKQYSNEQIAYAISEIEAAFISPEIAQHLPQKPDQPILKLTESFYNKHNRPLVLGTSYFDHTMLKLRLVQAWG